MLTIFSFGNRLKTQFGAMCILEQKIQTDENVELEKKLGGQINFYTKRTFAKLNIAAEGIDSPEKFSGTFSHYFYNSFTPTESFYFSFSPDDSKTKLKYTQKISFRKKNYSISLSSSATSYITKNEFKCRTFFQYFIEFKFIRGSIRLLQDNMPTNRDLLHLFQRMSPCRCNPLNCKC